MIHTPSTTAATIDKISEIYATLSYEEGLRYIMSLFPENEPTWDRTVFTHVLGRQESVSNNIQVLKYFRDSYLLDCRISGYPDYRASVRNIAPSMLDVDLDYDVKRFPIFELFEEAARKTIENFKNILGVYPAWIWSGNGFHFIIPMECPVLETISDFNGFEEPSRRFMHFLEKLMTSGQSDPNHKPSFKNLMLRVPNTLNYDRCVKDDNGKIMDIPDEAIVRLIGEWDGNVYRVDHNILTRYYMWLEAEEVKKIDRQIQRNTELKASGRLGGIIGYVKKYDYLRNYDYIDRILGKPVVLEDYRNYCVWRITVPYLVNIKGVSGQDTQRIVESWLYKCHSVKRLKFNPGRKVQDELNHVGTYWPIADYELKVDNPGLYKILESEGCFNS